MAKYKLLKAQKEFLEVPHKSGLDVALYQGGYGSGKTWSGSLLGILLCLRYKGIKGLVGAQTFPLVRDTTLVTYLEHLEALGFKENRDYFFKKSESKLIFKNGSEILFRSLDEPGKIKSLNLGFVEIEEMSDTKESTFKMLLGRLRQAIKPEWKELGFQYRLFGHTNPEPDKGWLYKVFNSSKVNYRKLIASTTENTFLSDSFVESLKDAYDEDYYNINVLGQDGDYSSGLVVKGFSNCNKTSCEGIECKHCTKSNVKTVNYFPDMDLHITCDFNVDPMSWALAHKTEDKVFFFDEIVIENTTTEKTCEEFLRRYPKHTGKIIINGDASGDNRSTASEFTNYATIKNTLKDFGYIDNVEFKLKGFNPRIKSRVAAFNSKVLNLKGIRCVFVDHKCKWVIYNLENLKYKVGTSLIDAPSHHQIKQSKELKFLMHIYDAISYLVDFYWPIKIEQPEKE